MEEFVHQHTQLTPAEVEIRDALVRLRILTARWMVQDMAPPGYMQPRPRPCELSEGEAAAVAVEALRRFEERQTEDS